MALTLRNGDDETGGGMRIGVGADFVVDEPGGDSGGAHVAVGRRRATALRMEDPNGAVALQMLRGSGQSF